MFYLAIEDSLFLLHNNTTTPPKKRKKKKSPNRHAKKGIEFPLNHDYVNIDLRILTILHW